MPETLQTPVVFDHTTEICRFFIEILHTTAKPKLDFCVHLCKLMNTLIKKNNKTNRCLAELVPSPRSPALCKNYSSFGLCISFKTLAFETLLSPWVPFLGRVWIFFKTVQH